MTDLSQALLAVEDPPSFAAFVAALQADLAGDLGDTDAPGHRTYADALTAMIAWARTPAGRSALNDTDPWQAAAKLLVAGAFHD